MSSEPQTPPPAGLPTARAVPGPAQRNGWHGWLGWLVALAAVPPGWILIGHANRWHWTPPVVILGLAWLGLVGAALMLVRAANATIDDTDIDWFVAAGSRDELEREKRNLIRAIKEVEFDRDTGKISGPDAQQLIAMYRARAIEVFKALDAPPIESPRDRIMAEVKARAQLARTAAKPNKRSKAAKRAAAATATAPTATATADASADPDAETDSTAAASSGDDDSTTSSSAAAAAAPGDAPAASSSPDIARVSAEASPAMTEEAAP